MQRLGKYRLERRLAVGGMAEVYLAVAEGLSGFEKRVVVKRLLPQYARDAEVLTMFLDEARLLATLKHAHIAEIYDVGKEGDDHFFAMEYVAGRDLRDILNACGGAPLPLPEGLAIIVAVADGVAHAHESTDAAGRAMGIVHRDVSPSNVLIGAAGEVKLIDFGVAKWAAQKSATRQGVLKGKCAYMSPEQCRAETLDGRSDIFSLGVLLYEVTTGSRPFDGQSDFEILNAIVAGECAPPSRRTPGYPVALQAIVMRALRANRDDRYAAARDLARDLKVFAVENHLTLAPSGLAALVVQMGTDEPAPALEKTATDYVAASGAARGRELSSRKIGAAARVGVGAVVVLAAGLAVLFALRPGRSITPAVVASPASVPIEPKVAPAVAGVPVVPAPPESPQSAPKRFEKRRAPPVKVWDPDSPVPP